MGFSLKKIFGGGSGGSIPQYNTAPLKNILNQGADKQRGLAEGLPGQISPITTEYGQKQGQAGANYLNDVKTEGANYVNSIANPELRDKTVARINENSFRNVPAAQQAIRESLAGTGRMGNGRAQNLLANPVLDAARTAGDATIDYDNTQDQNRVDALGKVFGNNSNALATKLGLDSDTARTLMENGRGDLITKAANLMGIEGDLSQGLFDLENTSQQTNIATAQAAAQRRAALLQSLLGIGGQIAGGVAGGMAGRAAAPAA